MDHLLQDLRYALRQLARTPAFTIIAAVTLAVGIGANTALYSLINAIFVRPLPGVHNDGRLVWIAPFSTRSGHALEISYPDFADYRDSTGAFAQAAAFGRTQFSLSAGDKPVRVAGGIVSANYFTMLGVTMAKGRAFTPDEDRTPGTHPVAIVSYKMWQERLGGDPDILGRKLVINGLPFTVVGVAPERFNGAEHEEMLEIWVPMMMQARALPEPGDMLADRGSWWLKAIGQLKPDVSLEQAKTRVATMAARIARADSANHEGVAAEIVPVTGGLSPNTGNDIYPIAGLAAAATGLILLICCANVSNMLLARAVGRRREIGVRLSLGASRGRVVRQLLTEATLLSCVAAGAGILVSVWATELLSRTIPVPIEISPDRNTLLFALGAALVTGFFFGLVPALHATRGDLTTALKDSGVGHDRRRSRLQSGFVVAQLSLSLVLLVMAGMFLSSLYRSSRVDVGFEATSHVLAASFDLGLQGYAPDQATTFVNSLRQRVAGLPGVADVSFTNDVPMGERRLGGELMLDPRETSQSAGELQRGTPVFQNVVRPDFFRTLGIGLVRGREFAATDVPGSEQVAIVSEDIARAAWPGSDPIGKHVSAQGTTGPFYTVVGVAREALTAGVTEKRRPTLYLAQLQHPKTRDLTILVRSPGDASRLAQAVVSLIHDADKNMPVYGVETLAQYRRDRLSEPALGSTLLAIVGTVALLLACIGVYSVISFSVGQRTREIGLRIALGAASQQVIALFMRDGLRLTAIGLGVGLALSAVLAKLLSATFMGISAVDSLAFIGVAVLLAAISGVASWIPARRAASVDPMVALRSE